MASLSEEQLQSYIRVLKQQSEELAHELQQREMWLRARYPLNRFQKAIRPRDLARILREVRARGKASAAAAGCAEGPAGNRAGCAGLAEIAAAAGSGADAHAGEHGFAGGRPHPASAGERLLMKPDGTG